VSSTDKRITELGLTNSGATLVPCESLLVTTRATLGSVALAAIPLATNQGFKTAVFGPDVDPSFGYHLFHRLKPELTRRASGTTFLEISGSQFEQVVVAVPALPEQRRIAAILDAADDAIRSTERLIAKLEEVKFGLLHDLMTRGFDESGALRDEVRHPGMFQRLGDLTLPVGWAVCELNSVVDRQRAVVYGILMPGYGFAGGVPVVKVKDIKDGRINEEDLLLTDPRIDDEYRRSRIREGDLLFSIRGTVGRTAFVPQTLDGANITQDTARIAIAGANPRFVAHYLRTPRAVSFVELHTLGQAVRGINLRDVRRIPLILPPRSEQDALAGVLDAHDATVEAGQQRYAKLRLLKAGLMDDLLTGRVRVIVDEDAA
jgi:type I restriction enzyme S subunit